MKKKFEYEYDFSQASVKFEVDLEKFDETNALMTLNFFRWKWDRNADPVSEAMKKYAMCCIRIATFDGLNTSGVIKKMNDLEGYAPVDGSMGIKLIYVEGIELDEDLLELKE